MIPNGPEETVVYLPPPSANWSPLCNLELALQSDNDDAEKMRLVRPLFADLHIELLEDEACQDRTQLSDLVLNVRYVLGNVMIRPPPNDGLALTRLLLAVRLEKAAYAV